MFCSSCAAFRGPCFCASCKESYALAAIVVQVAVHMGHGRTPWKWVGGLRLNTPGYAHHDCSPGKDGAGMFCAQGHVQCRSAGAGASVVACTICANPTEVTLFSTEVLIVVKQRVRQLLAALTRRLDHGIPYGRCEGMHGSGQAPCWWSYLLVRSTGMLQRRCEPESAANAVPQVAHTPHLPSSCMQANERVASSIELGAATAMSP